MAKGPIRVLELLVTTSPGGGPRHVWDLARHLPRDEFELIIGAPRDGEFFDRFRQLNVRSNSDLDALVERAQRIVNGVEPQSLRDNNTLRQHVATQFSQVQSVIDGMLVDRPRRRIIRNQEAE